MRKLLSFRLFLFWACIVIGGLLLGAAEKQGHSQGQESYNWDAIAALAVIGIGFVSGTWAIVSMAIKTAIVGSERTMNDASDARFTRLKEEMSHPETGYVPVRVCKILHAQSAETFDRLEADIKERESFPGHPSKPGGSRFR
jgi:hypothetical protein